MLVGRQPGHRVVGAAEFERARALEVLALEVQLSARAIVQRSRCDDGRAMRNAGDLPRGVLNVRERGTDGRVRDIEIEDCS